MTLADFIKKAEIVVRTAGYDGDLHNLLSLAREVEAWPC